MRITWGSNCRHLNSAGPGLVTSPPYQGWPGEVATQPLETTLRMPFQKLRLSNRASHSKQVSKRPGGAEMKDCLPKTDPVTNRIWRNRFRANTMGYQPCRFPSKRTGCGFQLSKTRQHPKAYSNRNQAIALSSDGSEALAASYRRYARSEEHTS